MKTYILYEGFTPEGFYLTQGYGVNPGTYSQYGLLWHEGVDMGDKADPKPKVRAAHDGIVIQDFDTPKGNYGEYVVIWDDKQLCATWYCHLEENFVSQGQRVKAGDTIGIMGATGNVTGKHLHFNFVLTDASGTRLHNTKAKNFGFLDPQVPFDPNPPKFPPGVEKYKVEWKTVPNNQEDMSKELDACLADRKKFWEERDKAVADLNEEKKKVRDLTTERDSNRTRYEDKKKQYDDFVAWVVGKLKPAGILPTVADESYAKQLIENIITEESLLRSEYKRKEKEWIEEKKDLVEEQERLKRRIADLESKLTLAQNTINDLTEELDEIKEDLQDHQDHSQEVIKDKKFLDELKKFFEKLFGKKKD